MAAIIDVFFFHVCDLQTGIWPLSVFGPIPKTARSYSLKAMDDLGRMLAFFGGLLLVIGLIIILAGKVNLPLGRLPGDIVYRSKHTTFYFPLVTCIVLSVILSLVLYIVNRMR